MAAETLAQLSFVSWLRRGLAAGIERVDGSSEVGIQATVRLDLAFSKDEIANPQLTLIGPGDIAGLDSRAVVRTFPAANVNEAESAFFVSVDFDQADLPWRYTPARFKGERTPASGPASDQLRPWLTLLVLDEQEEIISLTPASATQRLPILKVAVANLPDLNESWGWAHVQGVGPNSGGAATDIKKPGQVVGRIMSPRALRKRRPYVAFLVPTFERGRVVGIGGQLNDTTDDNTPIDALTLAWPRDGNQPDVELPVYYQWRFQTGEVGSFAELAAQLAPTEALPKEVGRRNMDVSKPGLGLPAVLSEPMAVGGALRSDAAKTEDAAEEQRVQAELNAWTTALGDFMRQAEAQLGTRKEKIVVPPLYGRWYAGQKELDRPGAVTNPPWFYRLNRHPRFRVAAALGTKVVQRDQQALMASAWQQVDHLLEINAEKSRMQAARLAGSRLLFRQIVRGSFESRLTATSPVHGQISFRGATLFAAFRQSPLRGGLFDPQWRRISSAQGRIGRRLGLHRLPAGQPTRLLEQINNGELRLAPPPVTPPDTFTVGGAFKALVPAGLPGAQVDALVAALGNDRLTFWGLVLFWSARHLLVTLNGQFWWLTNKLLHTGLELIRVASGAGLASEKLAQKLQTDTLQPNDVVQAPFTANFAAIGDLPSLASLSALPLPEAPGAPATGDSAEGNRFRDALLELTGYRRRELIDPPPLVKVNLPSVADLVAQSLRPSVTIPKSIEGRHQILIAGFPWTNPDPLEEIQAAPEFPQPMCLPLQAVSDEWLLPGLSQLAPNSVAALLPSQEFIEAYMVGLNHEMTRELLWNSYPIDQRGTYFFQFWDSRGFIKGTADPVVDRGVTGLKDITAIHRWGAKNLGQNTSRVPRAEQLVLVVRGDIVRQYPNFTAHAARAKLPPGAGAKRVPDDTQLRFPVFQGRLGTDVSYHGFDLDRVEARGNPGWFFILQEHPAAVRFGPEGEVAGGSDAHPGDFTGATTAAQVAVRAAKPPVRVAIHAAEILPAPPP